MKAEEVLNNTFDKHEWRMASPPYYDSEDAVIDAMKEYAKYKCKELLEIVADNAKILYSYSSPKVDKDSILNTVDLDEFIK